VFIVKKNDVIYQRNFAKAMEQAIKIAAEMAKRIGNKI
jgi:hypothetical protein